MSLEQPRSVTDPERCRAGIRLRLQPCTTLSSPKDMGDDYRPDVYFLRGSQRLITVSGGERLEKQKIDKELPAFEPKYREATSGWQHPLSPSATNSNARNAPQPEKNFDSHSMSCKVRETPLKSGKRKPFSNSTESGSPLLKRSLSDLRLSSWNQTSDSGAQKSNPTQDLPERTQTGETGPNSSRESIFSSSWEQERIEPEERFLCEVHDNFLIFTQHEDAFFSTILDSVSSKAPNEHFR